MAVTSVGVAGYYKDLFDALKRYDPRFVKSVLDYGQVIESYSLFAEKPEPHLIFTIQTPDSGLLASFSSHKPELNQEVSLRLEKSLGIQFMDPSSDVLRHYSPALTFNGVFFEAACSFGFEQARERIDIVSKMPFN